MLLVNSLSIIPILKDSKGNLLVAPFPKEVAKRTVWKGREYELIGNASIEIKKLYQEIKELLEGS